MEKQLLNADQLIEHMKTKGVMFSLVNENDAKNYLQYSNNFFRVAAYRKNYTKYTAGENCGKYINLEFAYLKDLASMDMLLRYTFLQITLDIEHYIKLELLREIELNESDPYQIVNDYRNSLDEGSSKIIDLEISRASGSIYSSDIVKKYTDDFPVWVFIDLLSFGQFIFFYQFCARRFNNKSMLDTVYQLKTCKEIRNACAHSSCILNDLRPNTSTHKVNYPVSRSVSQITGISASTGRRKMSNARIIQIVTALYVFKNCVTSSSSIKRMTSQLSDLVNRMNKHLDYYSKNDMIKSSICFLSAIIREWFLT